VGAGVGGWETFPRSAAPPDLPDGPRWCRGSLRVILRNPKYAGFYSWNRQGNSKYHSVHKGGVEKIKERVQGAKDAADWFLEPGAHEALIDQRTFDLCQERLEANRGGRRSSQMGCYLFSDLVVCGHCGRTLRGKKARGKPVYTCDSRPDPRTPCLHAAVREDYLRRQVVNALQEELLAPPRLEALRRRARERDEAERSPAARETLEKRLAELHRMINQGNNNLAFIPQDLIPGVVEQIRGLEQERKRLQEEMSRRDESTHAERLEAVVREREDLLWQLREAEKEADPLILRRVYKAFIDHIEIRWENGPWKGGTQVRRKVVGGVIHFLGSFPEVNYGSW
jgi:hypothetical protein